MAAAVIDAPVVNVIVPAAVVNRRAGFVSYSYGPTIGDRACVGNGGCGMRAMRYGAWRFNYFLASRGCVRALYLTDVIENAEIH